MPLPARLIVYAPGNKPLVGPIPVDDLEVGTLSGSEIHEFLHHVYTVDKGYFYALLYGVDFVRKHEPLQITKPIDKLSVPLKGYLVGGIFLPKVEIRWYEYDKKHHREHEYFRMTLEHVRLNSITTILHDAKDSQKERYGHLEAVSFCYQKITWLYVKGHILHTDIWNGGFFKEEDEKDFSGKKDDDKANASNDELLIAPLKVKFTKGVFVKPKDGFQFDKKTKVQFIATINRKPDRNESKVFVKLYAVYNGKTEDLRLTEEGRLREDGTWETELKLRKPESYEQDNSRKPDAQVEYYAEIENKFAEGNFRIESIKVPELEEEIVVPWFIDVHAHINAPKAAPLPTIWVQTLLTKVLKPSWKFMENVVVKKLLELIKHDLADFASLDTLQLGDLLGKECQKVRNDPELDSIMGPADKRDALQIVMPMDMELGCYDGYEGKTIYQQGEDGKPGYWSYEKEGKREWVGIKPLEAEKLEKIKMQLKNTHSVLRGSHGKILPFFPYDPRRWQNGMQAFWSGNWEQPFRYLLQVVKEESKVDQFCAIGFKLYTALGYRPDDYKPREVKSKVEPMQRKKMEAKLPHLRNFYETCQANKIPVICHGSSGGVFAHDYALYYDYLFPADGASNKEKLAFFDETFISPFAWENVLKDFPNLYLCLAHFGGEREWAKDLDAPESWVRKLVELMEQYANFYVDLSYFIFDSKDKEEKFIRILEEHPKIKEKLLFGTDWYLIGSEEAKYGKYNNYIKAMYTSLAESNRELLAYITVINPKRFLNINAVAEKLFTLFGSECDIRSFVEKLPDSVDKFKSNRSK